MPEPPAFTFGSWGAMSIAIRLAFVPLLCLACGGCGVVFFPTVNRYPDPVNAVELRDAATGAIIPDGIVRCTLLPSQYKGYPGDARSPWFSPASGSFTRPDGEPMRVTRSVDGRFVPEHRLVLGVWQWLWPLWSWATRGDFLYYGHDTQIMATAPGYDQVSIEFAPGTRPDDFHLIDVVDAPDNCRLEHGGLLVFALRRHEPAKN